MIAEAVTHAIMVIPSSHASWFRLLRIKVQIDS